MFGPIRVFIASALLMGGAYAAEYPAPQQGDYVAHDFRFHDGQVIKDLRLHYTTVGDKSGEPVLVLHGTAGTGAGLLTPESPAACSVPARRSMRANTTSSCPT